MPNGKKSYAKWWVIGDTVWSLIFKKRMERGAFGWCVYDQQRIEIKEQISNDEKFLTLIHECLHALSDEYKIKLSHKQIYQLERALSEFIVSNASELFKILF